jgi:hypothetical protein
MNMKKSKTDLTVVKPEPAPEAPQDLSDFAQKSVDQAQAAFERASDVAHANMQAFDAAAGALKARSLDFQLKAMEIAQANVNTTFDFFRRALAIRDPSQLFALNQEFASSQLLAFSQQANELNELSLLMAKETTGPIQEGVLKSFSDFAKTFGH